MNKKIYFALIGLASLLVSCESFSDALETKEITPISITLRPKITLSGFDNTNGLKLILNNYVEGIRVEKELTSSTVEIGDLIPGMYSIVISGKLKNKEGVSYYLNGSLVNHPILNNRATIDLPISGQKISPLIFKEIFYSGTANFYFRNQFYEIYNNSEDLHYLDGIYFAVLYPTKSTSTLPVWPQEDGDKYVYTERIWKFPGNGTTYPLKPGESCVISQFAANHKLDIYNPNSPVDCSSSEFEFNMNNPKFPDQPALDMEHVYFNGKADKGRAPQYLTSIFGGAYVIFKVPEGETYDPVNNPALQTKDRSSSSKKLYAKIPIEYVLDGVEAVDDETKVNAKRMPGVLDAGITTVGASYNSLGIARKKMGENPDGTPVLQDTNNSTEDFERGVVPMFRRYNAKMPSWNHTLK